ncbi:hypothetical protein OS175_05990 [Marinicella sp. S1101]|uniref:hypothetical protein n=1 Tax=Marinicella marina TaxID=2996016 RepID=UPI0022608432|nr:hypothetical protein [Marinicella marina]MCX7553422.1 hypothetical protein [Marinicella marina]MDJ1140046.1 hypothetical protein [Marinicella marina]
MTETRLNTIKHLYQERRRIKRELRQIKDNNPTRYKSLLKLLRFNQKCILVWR